MILAIDFDRVLHNIDGPKDPGKRMGRPIPGAVEAMNSLRQAGHTLIVHTLWATTSAGNHACRSWLTYFHIPYDQVTIVKPKADIYLDDRGLRFTDWEKALEDIKNFR